jgi:phage I-like protein
MKPMDKNKAHDFIHMWYGGKAENCPVCCGTCTDEAEMMAEAAKITAQIARPMPNPMLSYDQTIYANEEGKPNETPATPPVETPPTQAPGKETPRETVTASELRNPGFMTDVMSFSEGDQGLPKKIKIIPTGTFKTQAYGEVKITKTDLLEMADNYRNGARAGVPIDIDHDQKAAAGWITDVEVADDGMYAQVEWTKLGEDKLSTKEYRFFSPEFAQSYIDPEHSHELSNVLIAGSLVNRPMFKELPAIAGSEDGGAQNLTAPKAPLMLLISKDEQSNAHVSNDNQSLVDSTKEKPMDLQTILAKEKSARTSDEQLFVAANLDKLSDEQKVAEGFIVPAVVTASEPTGETTPETKTETTPDAAPEKTEDVITAAEKSGMKVLSASEYAALKSQADKGALAFKELEKKEITDRVTKFTFNENGGKIAPAQVEPIVNLMLTMSEPQRVELTKVLESLPSRQIFGEQGSDEDLDKSKAADILTAKISEKRAELMKGNSALTFSEATRQATLTVVAENRELYNESKQVKASY